MRSFSAGCALLMLFLVAMVEQASGQATTEVPERSEAAPVVLPGPPPPPQEPILTPIPTQFDWMQREVRPNPLLESLLTLSEGPPRLFMSVSLSEEYSDNFFQDDSDPEAEYQTSVIIGTAYRLERGRSFVALANTISANYRARAEESNFGFVNLSLNAGHQLPRLFLALNESFIREDDPDAASRSGIRSQRGTFMQNTISPQALYTFSRNTAARLAYTNTVTLEDEQLERYSNGVTTSLQHHFSRVVNGSFSYAFNATVDEEAANTFEHSVTAGLGYILNQLTSLSVEAFGTSIERDQRATDSRLYGVLFGVQRRFTPFLSAFVAAGASLIDRQGQSLRAAANWQIALQAILGPSTTMTFSSQQAFDDTTGDIDDVGIVLRTSASLEVRHTIALHLHTLWFASFTRSELLESIGTEESIPGREDDFWRAGATASFAVSRTVALSLQYLFQLRDSNLPDNDFTEHRVTITVSAGFILF